MRKESGGTGETPQPENDWTRQKDKERADKEQEKMHPRDNVENGQNKAISLRKLPRTIHCNKHDMKMGRK